MKAPFCSRAQLLSVRHMPDALLDKEQWVDHVWLPISGFTSHKYLFW